MAFQAGRAEIPGCRTLEVLSLRDTVDPRPVPDWRNRDESSRNSESRSFRLSIVRETRVVFRSAKDRPFAERKATIRQLFHERSLDQRIGPVQPIAANDSLWPVERRPALRHSWHGLLMAINDPAVVRRAVAGDRAAQGALARGSFARLVALCQSRVGQRADAEELAQEALLRAIRSLSQLAAVESFDAWLRGIAVHLCLDWHRGRGRDKRLPLDTSLDRTASDPAQLAATADENEQLRQQIQELPPELQEVLYLHYYDQLSYDEMAGWLGVARATVNERLAKARGLLRVRLSPAGGRADAQ